MSDEAKVQDSTDTSRKKLATLGQVKDALDKRDEKIGSLKEEIVTLVLNALPSAEGGSY